MIQVNTNDKREKLLVNSFIKTNQHVQVQMCPYKNYKHKLKMKKG